MREQFIYLARSSEPKRYKIGLSRFPDKRVANLRNSVKGDWRLVDQFPGDRTAEADLHRRLRSLRDPTVPPCFLEWYRDSPKVPLRFKEMKGRKLTPGHIRPQQAFRAAVSLYPSQADFAAAIGRTPNAVAQALRDRDSVCPVDWVLTIEREVGLKRWLLRPDLYPPEEYRNGE